MREFFNSDDFRRILNENRATSTNIVKAFDSANEIKLKESVISMEDNQNLTITAKEPAQYELQRVIRENFGKNLSLNTNTIADHEDFKSLVYGGRKKQYITTVFIDIKGSTRLTLKYPDSLDFIYTFKNAVIKACIEVIRAFDGTVHRIMGDAVLGFFGSSKMHKAQSILDCMNCVSVLKVVLEYAIKPMLIQEKPDFNPSDFGFRVGCNFGDDNEILWGNYGFGEVGEVSPTGLPVDLAAKLQSHAKKNEIMMGQGLLEYFNWPEEFSKIQTKIRDGQTIEEKYITASPNYYRDNGSLLNYKMRLLDQDKYILGLPLPKKVKKHVLGDKYNIIGSDLINLEVFLTPPNEEKRRYISNSEVVRKGSKIEVIVSAKISFSEKLKIRFYKKNNSGFNNEPELEKILSPETQEEDFDFQQGVISGYQAHFRHKQIKFSRDCSYKGLHLIKCEVENKEGELIFCDYVYVPIA